MPRSSLAVALLGLSLAIGCGPSAARDHSCEAGTDINTDLLNCGACGHSCQMGISCANGQCANELCNPGDKKSCYEGNPATEGVGPCHAGSRTCDATGHFGACDGEVTPGGEICGDHIDNNCNGAVDENTDADGDGFTTCEGDCCDSMECSNPKAVNPGAFEVAGNGVDDDCDGVVDNPLPLCDTGLASNSSDAMDYAKAIDLCQTATPTDRKWGVLSATLSLADGTGAPAPDSRSIRPHYGTGLTPKMGQSLMVISTGAAAGTNDVNPSPDLGNTESAGMGTSSGFPADFLAANNGLLPNLAGCPDPSGTNANDPVMLTLKIRVPTNAGSFSLQTNFFTAEFPEYVCTAFNDFFVVLLDSTYTGTPSNPTDKNLAVYTQQSTMKKYPVGVNLAFGDTGLFSQCVNGGTGCAGGSSGSISTCTGTSELTGTGMDQARSGSCDTNSLIGGGTGWLTTNGNVKAGEIITLRIAIWDTSDDILDSLAVIDNFKWSVDNSMPGTVIGREVEEPLPSDQVSRIAR